METKVLIADDHKLFREGLRTLIEKEPDMKVIAEVQDGRNAIQIARELKPDIIIMDIAMPGLNGIEATRIIKNEIPDAKIIALSMHSDKNFVIETIKAGASGYVLKDCAFKDLFNAIKTVQSNRFYLEGLVTDIVLKSILDGDEKQSSAFSILTSREKEVLQLIAEGKNTKEIAGILYLSTKTVETYRKRIMTKLNIFNIAELTRYAIKEGITPL